MRSWHAREGSKGEEAESRGDSFPYESTLTAHPVELRLQQLSNTQPSFSKVVNEK